MANPEHDEKIKKALETLKHRKSHGSYQPGVYMPADSGSGSSGLPGGSPPNLFPVERISTPATPLYARLLSVFTGVIALVSVVVAIWQGGQILPARPDITRMEAERVDALRREAERAELRAEESRRTAFVYEKRMGELLAQLQATTKFDRPLIAQLDPRDKQAIDDVKSAQATLDQKLKALEGAIMADPLKAVSLPLMRKDLDSLQDKTRSDIDAVRGELARLYNLVQWFIALMVTIALGVFGLAIGNIRSERRSDSGRKDDLQPPSRIEAAPPQADRDVSVVALPRDGGKENAPPTVP